MRFSKVFAMVLAAGFALSSAAFGGERELKNFLTSLEATWNGEGSSASDTWDGGRIEQKFRLRVRVRYVGANNWEVRNERRLANGSLDISTFVFGVRGDRLLVGAVTPNEPVELLDSTDWALVYRLLRHDPRTGRVYRYTYDTRLVEDVPERDGDVAPLILDGYNTVDLNGQIIAEDRFQLQQ